MFGRMYVILYFDPRIFVLVRWLTPSQTSLNRILCLSISTRITLEIELFTVSGGGKSMRSLAWL